MTILFDCLTKSNHRTFGRGILAYVASNGRKPYTASEAAEWAQISNQTPALLTVRQRATLAEMAEFDRMAEESAWQDAYEAGCLPL